MAQTRIIENQQYLSPQPLLRAENNCAIEEKKINLNIQPAPIIHMSTNYKLFVPHDLQRKLQEKNLKRLRESALRHNLMHENAIKVVQTHAIVDEDHPYLVVDGNHRKQICQELHIPIYFIICNNFIPNDIIDTGYCVSKWSTPLFCDFYCKFGIQPYINFRKFTEDFGLDMHTALPITKAPKNRKGLSEIFRTGNFTFDDEQEVRNRTYLATQFLERLISYGMARKDLKNNSNFYCGFSKLMNHPDYDQKKLLDKFDKKMTIERVPTFTRPTQFYECFKHHFLNARGEE